MWRPGKLRFLISVKNPLPIRPAAAARKRCPCGAPPVARFAPPVGLRPPFVTHPATLSHPDRRAVLIPFAAQHRPTPRRVPSAASATAWRGLLRSSAKRAYPPELFDRDEDR